MSAGLWGSVTGQCLRPLPLPAVLGGSQTAVPGRYHMSVSLPGGKVVTADYRDPITVAMHAIWRARELGQQPDPDDLAAVIAYLDANAAQIDACARGVCDHEP
jgi:hypothetical protein